MRVCLFAFSLLLFVTSAKSQTASAPPARSEALSRAHAATLGLVPDYNQQTGLFNTTGWWNSANAITALVDEARLAHTRAARKSLSPLLANTLTAAPHGDKVPAPNFLNEFYDDEGWWALAWIDSYDLTHHKPYLRMAETIFTDMSGAWDNTCNGGIWWSKKRTYKNAIANELFLSVSSSLALHTRGKERAVYIDWANREWQWFAHTGMINSDSLVNDGLRIDKDTGACTSNGKTTWTYNQGVLLSGLSSLHQASPQPDLLPAASRIATAAITRLVDSNGILHDPCEPICGGDGVSFKGIFVRNLAHLQAVAPDPAFPRFLTTNAVTLWQDDRTTPSAHPEQARFSTVWSGPPTPDNAAAQTSALDLLNAAASVAP